MPKALKHSSRDHPTNDSTEHGKQDIAADLRLALTGHKIFSIDLNVEVLSSHKSALKASLNKDANDALPFVVTDEGAVAMLVIKRDGSLYRNNNALEKLRLMWRGSFDAHIEQLVPVFSKPIDLKNLGVAGLKLITQDSACRGMRPIN